MSHLFASKRLDAALAVVAGRQHGVFSFSQVEQCGGDSSTVRRRLNAGRWIRLSCRVYTFAGAPLSFHSRVVAACLTAGDQSVASHATAAELWIPTGAPCRLHVWSPRRVNTGELINHVGRLDKADVTRLGAIPITRPERTVIDLASILTLEQLEGTLDDFLRRDLVQLRRLEERLAAVGGRAGLSRLRRLVRERRGAGASESELETRFLRALIQEGFPIPERQYEIHNNGRFVARVDFAYPQVKLAIEAYGKQHHSVWSDHEHDLARQNEITALGWRVIVVTWARLHTERAALMRQIARALVA